MAELVYAYALRERNQKRAQVGAYFAKQNINSRGGETVYTLGLGPSAP